MSILLEILWVLALLLACAIGMLYAMSFLLVLISKHQMFDKCTMLVGLVATSCGLILFVPWAWRHVEKSLSIIRSSL